MVVADMAFFDKSWETITTKSKDIASKAKEIAEVSSLNGQISACENRIQQEYLEIGKVYYENYKDTPEELFGESVQNITDSLNGIKQLKESIQSIKHIAVCASCGTEVPADSTFCFACGAFMVKEEVEDVVVEEKKEEVIE